MIDWLILHLSDWNLFFIAISLQATNSPRQVGNIYGNSPYWWLISRSTQPIGNKSCSSSVSNHSSGAALKSLNSQTTTLNEVAAAHSNGPTSISKPKATTKASKKTRIVEDDEFESLEEKDDTKEHEAALFSPMKGKDFQQLTAMSFTYHFHSFFDRYCRQKSRLNIKKKNFLPMRRRRSRTMLYHISCKNIHLKLIASLLW